MTANPTQRHKGPTTSRCHVAHPSLFPTRMAKRQWRTRSRIYSDQTVVIGCPGRSGGRMNVKKDRDTLMGHTLEFKNNPEEDAPWVAKWSEGQRKSQHEVVLKQINSHHYMHHTRTHTPNCPPTGRTSDSVAHTERYRHMLALAVVIPFVPKPSVSVVWGGSSGAPAPSRRCLHCPFLITAETFLPQFHTQVTALTSLSKQNNKQVAGESQNTLKCEQMIRLLVNQAILDLFSI